MKKIKIGDHVKHTQTGEESTVFAFSKSGRWFQAFKKDPWIRLDNVNLVPLLESLKIQSPCGSHAYNVGSRVRFLWSGLEAVILRIDEKDSSFQVVVRGVWYKFDLVEPAEPVGTKLIPFQASQ